MKNFMEPLQNDKCHGCRFCWWFDEYQQYACGVKGCYENSKYVEYQGIYENGEWK